MQIIIKNGDNYILTNIQEEQLDLFIKNNEKVFTEFNITEQERNEIMKGIDFQFIDGKIILDYTLYNERYKKEQLDKINLDFENKIKEYNSKYTEEEQKRFADKLRKAEIVLGGGSDYYIETIAQAKGVTPLDIATLIKTKADEFEAFYTQAEIDRDTAIANLDNNI